MINDLNIQCAEISMIIVHRYFYNMITKLTKIWGNNYKGGREFPNLIEEGKKKIHKCLFSIVIV